MQSLNVLPKTVVTKKKANLRQQILKNKNKISKYSNLTRKVPISRVIEKITFNCQYSMNKKLLIF